jgi:hypothetical protein
MRPSGQEGLHRLVAVFVGLALAMRCSPVAVFDLDRALGEELTIGLPDREVSVGREVNGPAAFVDQMVVSGTDR